MFPRKDVGPQAELIVGQARSLTHCALTCFFVFATVMCAAAGITLFCPQTRLSVIWEIKPNDYRTLLAYAPWAGIGFLLLSALMATAAWGIAHRMFWSWQLSIVIFFANGMGNAVQMLNNRAIEGAVGVTVTGAIVYWLTRPKIKGSFDQRVG